MTPCLVDLNVWIALVHDGHEHHRTARKWFDGKAAGEAFFCRAIQIGFLRLLANKRIAEACGASPRTLTEAWRCFDELHRDPRVGLLSEPEGLDAEFRRLSASGFPSSNLLPDAYLAAFANSWGISLATFDKGFANRGGVQSLFVVE